MYYYSNQVYINDKKEQSYDRDFFFCLMVEIIYLWTFRYWISAVNRNVYHFIEKICNHDLK